MYGYAWTIFATVQSQDRAELQGGLASPEWMETATIPGRVLVNFTRQLTVLFRSGIPLHEGLRILSQQAEQDSTAEVLHCLHGLILEGRYLSAGCARFPRIFNPIFVGLVRIGEQSGSLVKCLEMLSGWLERDQEVRQRLRSALTYPAVVLVVSLLCCTVLMTTLAPAFLGLFASRGTPLPWPTQVMATVVELQSRPLFWCLLVVAALALRWVWKAFWVDQRRAAAAYSVLFAIPGVKQVMIGATWSRYCGALSIMSSCGVSPHVLYKLAAQASGDPRVILAAQPLINDVMEGLLPSQHMQQNPHLYPRLLASSLAVGEDSGRSPIVADYLYRSYRLELDHHLNQLATLIEPFLLAFTSTLLFFIILALLLPLYGQLSTLGG